MPCNCPDCLANAKQDKILEQARKQSPLMPWERDTHKLWQGQSACPKCGRTWIGEAPFLLWNCDDPFHRYAGHQLRRITIELEPIANYPTFDVTIRDRDGEETLAYSTPEQIHNLVRAAIDKALESF